MSTPVGESRSLDVAIIKAIADTEGVAATDLDYTLHDYIDPDALDILSTTTGGESGWRLQFPVANHTVAVESEGTFTVDVNEYQWNPD